MLRYLRWSVNGGLLTLCCFFAAETAIGVLVALLAPSRAPVASAAAAPGPRETPSWSDREIILTRNLFHMSRFAPAPPPPEPESAPETEETELPLGLLGTISFPQPSDRGLAAIWNAERRERRVVGPGDEVARGRATVLAVERQRLLLAEDGAVTELAFDENGDYRPPRRARGGRRSSPNGKRRHLRRSRR